jgi:excisionase family DNA binding protein
MSELREAERLLTTEELSAWLQIPVLTIRQWRSDRTGPPGYRVGRHVRYRRDDVERWLEERSDAARRPA